MEYTPKTPQQQPPAQPQYELKKDMTGKEPPKRGPQVMTAVRYVKDEEGKEKRVELKFKVPMLPNPKCKKCFGRGYIGFDSRQSNALYICKKCYPML